jgi:hypothetical protein
MSRIGIIVICLVVILLGVFYFTPSLRNAFKSPSGATSTRNASTSESFSTWKEFVPRSKLFKVLLPSQPQYAKDIVDIPGTDQKRRYDMYASEKIDGTLFLISVITYPPEFDTSFTEDIIKQTIDELKRSKPDNKLTKLRDNAFKAQRSFDFSLDSGEFHVEGKAFMVDKIVYVLSYITRINDFDPTEYQHFIDSFELLDKQESSDKQEKKNNASES